jgi:hypothetical protein
MPVAIDDQTHLAIKAYLEIFIENVVKEYKDRKITDFADAAKYLSKKSSKGDLKPFHAAIIPPELLRISQFERGFSTGLGTTFEECAKLIGRRHHKAAERAYVVAAEVPTNGLNEIEKQVRRFEHAAVEKGRKPTMDDMIQSVLAISGGPTTAMSIQADIYLETKGGLEYFFEIKSPQPNKGQCLEILQRILRFHLLRRNPRPKAQAYFAMGYNPFGYSKADYSWSIAKTYFPLQEGCLIGPEFWSIIGGKSTFQELLAIYHEVGREKTKYMLDSLAFGF